VVVTPTTAVTHRRIAPTGVDIDQPHKGAIKMGQQKLSHLLGQWGYPHEGILTGKMMNSQFSDEPNWEYWEYWEYIPISFNW
jgi:hypothetical protein